MTATTTVFRTTTRPCPLWNNSPPSRRNICTRPVTIVTTIAGVETRLNPRTAWTRSSSPGPDRTTRASSTTPPTHTAIASAWRTPTTTPSPASGPIVREIPIIAAHSPGIPSAASCVVGSMTRSGRNAAHAEASRNTKPQQHGTTRPPGIDEVEPGARIERAPTAIRGDRCSGEAREQQRADQRDDPDRSQEPDRDEVLDALGPRGGDHDQRTEQHGDARASTAAGSTTRRHCPGPRSRSRRSRDRRRVGAIGGVAADRRRCRHGRGRTPVRRPARHRGRRHPRGRRSRRRT